MSTNYIIKEETMTDIADAIRNKTGITDPIPVPHMAEKISCITTNEETVLEGLTIDPTGQEIVRTPSVGVDGFGIVTVTGDVNLVPENVKEGVTIYGVEGTCFEGVDTSDATATPEDILDSATAYVNGVKITGTHACPPPPVLETLYVEPDGMTQTHAPSDGVDGFSEVYVTGDDSLVAENIKEGITIYGVKGSLNADSFINEISLDSVTIDPTGEEIVMTPEDGCHGWNNITVTGDENLMPSNIKQGVTIYGVTGVASNIGTSASVRIIDHYPTTADMTGNTGIVAQYDSSLIPSASSEQGTGIYGATAIYVEAPRSFDDEDVGEILEPSEDAIMLFDNGEQFHEITGGWTWYRVMYHAEDAYEGDPPHCTIGSNISVVGGAAVRINYLDGYAVAHPNKPYPNDEGYTKVCFDVYHIGKSAVCRMTQSSDGSISPSRTDLTDKGRFTHVYDWSAAQFGTAIWPGVHAGTSGDLRVYRVWLEP